jgi:predicted phosphoribosyltransferase
VFLDRIDAGKKLAHALVAYKQQPVVVYGLPRGGVVVAAEIARFLEAPLDIIVVRKIGHEYRPEYAVGAITEDGFIVTNPNEAASLDPQGVERAAAAELKEAQRRRRVFLGDRNPVSVRDRTAIIVDDGLATGLTMLAAIHEMRKRYPKRIVVAVPIAAIETVERLRPEVDELVAFQVPQGWFGAIGEFYENFEQVSDDEVVALMASMTTA